MALNGRLFSIHLGYVLGALPFPERFKRAHDLGFGAVEIPFPYATPAEDYAALLDTHGLRQISIGAPTTDYRTGEPGLAIDRRRRAAFAASLEQAAAYAQRIDCPAIHIFSGCRDPDLSEDAMRAAYCENLAEAASVLGRAGITALIEPINSIDFPGYYLDSVSEAVRCITTTGSANIRLILDLYHVRTMGLDPAAVVRGRQKLIQHVQFADFPGRHEPGTGTLDFAAVVAAMRAVGFAGSAGLEYIPTRPATGPLRLPPALADYAGLPEAAG